MTKGNSNYSYGIVSNYPGFGVGESVRFSRTVELLDVFEILKK